MSGSAAPARAAPPQMPAAPNDPALLPVQAQPRQPSVHDIEAGIAALRQRLHLTPSQEPLFDAVAEAMRRNARAMHDLPRPPRNARLTGIENLRLMLRFSEQQADGLKRLIPALEALYAQLSPQQRQAVDAFFSPPRRR